MTHSARSSLLSRFCACAGSGAGAVVASHGLSCVVLPAALGGALGISVSGATMTMLMCVTSPIIAAAAAFLLARWRGHSLNPMNVKTAAALALTVSVAWSTRLPHHDNTDESTGCQEAPTSQLHKVCHVPSHEAKSHTPHFSHP